MLNTDSSIFSQKSKKEVYEDYVKRYQLEKLISEMINSLVHSQALNPIIYMIKYLTGLLSEEEKTKNNISIPPPYPQGIPIVRFPKFKSKNILSKYLTRDNWAYIKRKKTLYNNNIDNLTKLTNNSANDPIGCCIVDEDVLITFESLFENIISDVHSISKNNIHKFSNDINSIEELKENDTYIFNEIKDSVDDILFEFTRNIEGYTINNIDGKNIELKQEIMNELLEMKKEGFFDESFQEIDYKNIIQKEPILKEEIEWAKNCEIGHFDITENYRTVFSNNNMSVMVFINFSNHFKLLIKGKKINESIKVMELYNKGIKIMKRISLDFEFINCKYGYITSDISLLGGGFRIYITVNNINVKNLKDEIKNLNFSKYYVLKNSLMIVQDYHLNEENQVEFMIKLFGKLSGLIRLNKLNQMINLPKLDLRNNSTIQTSYLASFDKLKNTISPYGRNINDVLEFYKIDEDNNFPILFDKNEYYTFYAFINKYILFSQYFNLDENYHISKPDNLKEYTPLSNQNLERLKNLKICVYRNLKNYPFSCNTYYKNNLEKIENEIKKIINKINIKSHIATYYSLEDKSGKDIIKQNNIPILHDEKMTKFNNNYPKNRGVIKFEFKNNIIFGIVNDIDHLKLFSHSEKIETMDQLNQRFIYIIEILNQFGREINFEFNKRFGYLNSNPSCIGNGMKIQLDLKLNRIKNDDIDDWNEGKGFIWKELNDNYFRFENQVCIGISETELISNFIFYIKQLIEIDENKTI